MNLYYNAYHVLDAVSSTLPASLEDVVASGTGAYAAIERSNFAINRSNAGGEEVWWRYLTWGQGPHGGVPASPGGAWPQQRCPCSLSIHTGASNPQPVH